VEAVRGVLDLAPEDITEGPLLRALVGLAAPLFVQNLVQVAQQVVDLFWLGRLSGGAVAAVGLAFPVVGLLFGVVGIAALVGTQVLVSQRVGGDDREGARRAGFTGLAVGIAIGLAGGVVMVLGARPVVTLLTIVQPLAGSTGEVPGLTVAYLGVFALALPLGGASDAIEGSFIGWGDSRAPLYISVVTVLVNVALDPVLIFGLGPVPRLGIRGAALATALGFGGGLLTALALVAAGRNEGMYSRAAAVLDPKEVRELLDVGLPVAGQQVARQTVRIAIVGVVFVAGGAAGLAAYNVGARVAAIAFIPAIGLQQAAQSVVGQNLGADRPERARRATWLGVALAAGGLAVVGVVQWLVPVFVTTLLTPDLGERGLSLAVEYLRILAYGYPAIGAAYLLEGGFNGARRTRTSFVATLAQFWAVRLPIAAVGGVLLGVGVVAVFWAVTLSNVAAALGLAAYYRYATAGGMLDRAVAATD
jgi:putative MATE family efflux protein